MDQIIKLIINIVLSFAIIGGGVYLKNHVRQKVTSLDGAWGLYLKKQCKGKLLINEYEIAQNPRDTKGNRHE